MLSINLKDQSTSFPQSDLGEQQERAGITVTHSKCNGHNFMHNTLTVPIFDKGTVTPEWWVHQTVFERKNPVACNGNQ